MRLSAELRMSEHEVEGPFPTHLDTGTVHVCPHPDRTRWTCSCEKTQVLACGRCAYGDLEHAAFNAWTACCGGLIEYIGGTNDTEA